jgi:hypothetical protein
MAIKLVRKWAGFSSGREGIHPGAAQALALGGALLLAVGLLSWQAGRLVEARQELLRVRAEVARLEALAEANRGLERRLGELQARWEQERARLPAREDYAGLLEAVGDLAQRWGVEVGPLSPTLGQDGAFPKVVTPLELSGPFERVLALMNALQGGERLLILKNVKFALSDEKEGGVRAQMVLEAYYAGD